MGSDLSVAAETAVEHIQNARTVLLGLKALFEEKGLEALARDAGAIDARLRLGLRAMAEGRIGNVWRLLNDGEERSIIE